MNYSPTKKKNKLQSLAKMGSKNPMWKGDSVGNKALHEWVKSRLPKTQFCQDCGKVPPYDLANISQKYKRDLSDWEWLCRTCHMTKDKRMLNLKRGTEIGEDNPSSKLKVVEVLDIKKRLALEDDDRKIAIQFGVSLSCIRHIKYGHTWGHVKLINGADLPSASNDGKIISQ